MFLFLIMKDICTYINESIAVASQKYLGYSKEEMLEDYKTLDDYPSMVQKKAIAAKYGIDSKKVNDIKKEVLLQLRAYRFTVDSFDIDDLRSYSRLDVPEKTKLQDESTAFILFMKDRLYKKLEERKLINKLYLAKGRDWNYHMTGADKSMINDYLKCIEILDSRDENKIEAKTEKEEILKGIVIKLVEQTKEFHDVYIDGARKWATKTYDNAPENIEKHTKKIKAAEIKRSEAVEHLKKEHGWRYYTANEYRELDKSVNNLSKSINELKSILRKTKEEFINENIEEAENTFNRNINNLAQKIQDKEFDFEKLTVNRISTDPKYFELEVTDGINNLYARSIWAAEWSDKVEAHFRFIITNKRQK